MNSPKSVDKRRRVLKSIQHYGEIISTILELTVGVIVLAAILVAIFRTIPELVEMAAGWKDAETFTHFLEEVLSVVVGIEFLKMLCQPTSENILETIIFLVARHMILANSGAVDTLISAMTVVILVLVKRFLKNGGHSFARSAERERIEKKLEMEALEKK